MLVIDARGVGGHRAVEVYRDVGNFAPRLEPRDEMQQQLRTADRSGFDLVRADDRPPPSPPLAGFLRLDFPMPVPGPIILGYGSHFGLGQFVHQA